MPVTSKPDESNHSKEGCMKFEVVLGVTVKIAAFEDVTPYNPRASYYHYPKNRGSRFL
jgi:hypothetical protein